MPLAEALENLYARRRFGIRPGLDRVALMLERLGHPERMFRSIHVAGTNGKGSTSAFLASILNAAGYRTGFFSSPHLVRFTERFRINGHEPPEERIATLLQTVLGHAPDDATFFEIVTALAAFYFADERVDLAVMEAGMGGRSDATAALPAQMTVITPISLDHCDYLGATLPQIADEKCRIAESGTPVILAPQPAEAEAAIRARLIPDRNRTFWAEADIRAAWNSDGSLDYHGIHATLTALTPGIPGRYQAVNAALALAAAEVLNQDGLPISHAALAEGIRDARWPGRMEFIPGEPPLLLDGAHNPAGAAALAESLAQYHYERLLLVSGIMADKDAVGLLGPLACQAAQAFAVAPAVERALDPACLAAQLIGLGLPTTPCASVAEGLRAARAAAAPGDLILVCGSLFTVGEAKAILAGNRFEGVRG